MDSSNTGGDHEHRGQSLRSFDKCHGLFYVPIGTRDRRLDVPSEGRGGESTQEASTHFLLKPAVETFSNVVLFRQMML